VVRAKRCSIGWVSLPHATATGKRADSNRRNPTNLVNEEIGEDDAQLEEPKDYAYTGNVSE
jgi:hypothetical protein